MEIASEETTRANGSTSDESPQESAEAILWRAAATLYRRRFFIVGVTVVAAIASVALALLLPKWYAAEARVLMPSGSGGGLSAIIGELSPAAAGLLGGGGGDYTRYLAILTSRSMAESAVKEFDLVRVYDLADEPAPMDAATAEFADNVEFEVDLEFDYLGIIALDQTPERAAAIANFLVDELNRRNADLAMQNARLFRSYVEKRYEEALTTLDSARAEMQAFQEEYGVIELPSMATAFLEAMAEQEGRVSQADVQYQALLQQYGPDNPQVQQAREVLRAARRAQQSALQGEASMMPVSMEELPELANEYAGIYQDILIQQEILEAAQPLYEQARFDEERERVAVQVVDPAVPPVRKAKPQRTLLVLTITVSAFILALVFALVSAWLRQIWPYLVRRFQDATS